MAIALSANERSRVAEQVPRGCEGAEGEGAYSAVAATVLWPREEEETKISTGAWERFTPIEGRNRASAMNARMTKSVAAISQSAVCVDEAGA